MFSVKLYAGFVQLKSGVIVDNSVQFTINTY